MRIFDFAHLNTCMGTQEIRKGPEVSQKKSSGLEEVEKLAHRRRGKNEKAQWKQIYRLNGGIWKSRDLRVTPAPAVLSTGKAMASRGRTAGVATPAKKNSHETV